MSSINRLYVLQDRLITSLLLHYRKKSQLKPASNSSGSSGGGSGRNQGEIATPLEVQTHLPLRTPDSGRTEYVAPVSS